MKSLFLLMVIVSVILSVDGVRILAVFPVPMRSHYSVFELLLKRLSEKGHHVVSLSHFSQKVPVANLTDVDVSTNVSTQMPNSLSFSMFGDISKWTALVFLEQTGARMCDVVLQHPEVKRIMQSKEKYYSDRPSYEVAKKYFGSDLPDFDTLRSKVSLILTNGHPVISTPRPLAPGYKELGGIHIPTSGPNSLPKDLETYLDAQDKNGVIYFSLGSIIDASTIPRHLLAAFSKAFEKVPQQILWKCSEREMPKLPKNVKCIEWAPQLSILCHPNVRLFITHGGLLGSQEAVYCGVPMLGMPLFGDHHLNMAYFVKKGLALQLDHSRVSEELISKALNEMLANKSFAETARRASLQFKDRQVPPVDEAVYWIEYLIRHGPDSLRMTVLDLAWYQYLLLDIVFVMIALLILVSWMVYKLLKLAFYKQKTVSLNSMKKLN